MRPRVKPMPCPKLLEKSCMTMHAMTMFTPGMRYNKNHQVGRPAMCRMTIAL